MAAAADTPLPELRMASGLRSKRVQIATEATIKESAT